MLSSALLREARQLHSVSNRHDSLAETTSSRLRSTHHQLRCRAVLKARTELDARKKDGLFVLISRANFRGTSSGFYGIFRTFGAASNKSSELTYSSQQFNNLDALRERR
jgi:hypothetical protein